MTDPDFVTTIEGGEIVMRYRGRECLRGKYVPPREPEWMRKPPVWLADGRVTITVAWDEDVQPDAIVGG